MLSGRSIILYAQNFPVFNSFYVNPYLYNPAEALTDYSQLFIVHRQQWTNIEGAPVMSGATFTSLMNESRAGFGGKIVNYKRGLLTTTDFLATYAYGIPLGQKNWLFLGLSGGAISNTIDVTRASNPDDPALLNFQNNNTQPAANAGFLLRAGSGLNIGLSLPQLFPVKFNNEASFSNTTVSPTDNVFFTIYYKRKVESKIVTRTKKGMRRKVKTQSATAPLELYMNYKYSKYNISQFEFLGKLNLSQYFWLGGSYKLPYGYTGNIGINTNRVVLSYSYEPNSQPEDGFSQGSHEVLLGIRFGNAKRFKRPAPVLRSVITKDPTVKHTARFQESGENPDKINESNEPVKKKFYVVVGTYGEFAKADEYKTKLIKEKFNAEVFYNAADRKYYVHVLETTKVSEAHEEIKNLRTYTKLRNARLLEVREK
ncbi:PorP/SprF family type IX secretion system membrane protein [Fulvivirgaceae bacterium PWU20]|uniref:PorP/SprF family type IX secretion system membrane protein n=2 Tax=Chryseosolibacter indicus TaxID=2782351 RepID=A0ABS5VPA0_9BACT|nr:PorP/SprF family type IX secretion system membrane protein [Chryseosolibacter indicus]